MTDEKTRAGNETLNEAAKLLGLPAMALEGASVETALNYIGLIVRELARRGMSGDWSKEIEL